MEQKSLTINLNGSIFHSHNHMHTQIKLNQEATEMERTNKKYLQICHFLPQPCMYIFKS